MLAVGGWFAGLVLAAAAGDGALVVLLDADPSTRDAATRLAAHEEGVRTLADAMEQLAPGRRIDEPDTNALERLLADAYEHDARFENAAAAALREKVLNAYQTALRPTDALAQLAARALHDASTAATADGNAALALQHATEARRRFAHVPLDATRHPPAAVAIFRKADQERARQRRTSLVVTSPVAATLVVDGRVAGDAGLQHTVQLEPGRYRIWLAAAGRRSFARDVELTPSPMSLAFDPELDWALTLMGDALGLSCTESCHDLLRRLGTRARVAKVLALGRLDGRADRTRLLELDVLRGNVSERELPRPSVALAPPHSLIAPVVTPATHPAFSWWYVVPGGVGQFYQGRALVGSAVVATQVGLLAWHALAIRDHQEASDDPRIEPDYRATRNLSASIFWGALAVGVLEALVYGAVTGESAP